MQRDHNETRAEYLRRISHVLDFIEKNLDANLSLENLSRKARYSPFHFHRVFSALIGENLNKFVTRKRVERIASVLLVEHNRSIKELAYTYGFNSESSFSRTFKQFYGISPTAFKSKGKDTLSKIGIEPFPLEKYICSIDEIKKWLDMNAQMEIKQLQEIKLLGIMQIGEFEKVGSLFERLMLWGAQKGILPHPGFKAITLYHDNPNVTQMDRSRYSTCITLDRDIDGEGEIRPLSIEKGSYAVGRFEIDGKDIPKAWESMLIWVLENGYRFRDGDYFEAYLNDHRTHPEEKLIIEINIPVEGSGKTSIDNKEENTNKEASNCLKPNDAQQQPIDYRLSINYMKALRLFFTREYGADFSFGVIYRANPDFSYFSLTPAVLRKLKLKFVIVFNHILPKFSICLSGQNKAIRKTYWDIFSGSNWKKYPVVQSIEKSLSIIDHTIVESPDLQNPEALTRQIETEALKFITDIIEVLE